MTVGLAPIAFGDQAGDLTLSIKFENNDLTSSSVAGVTAVDTKNWNLVTDTTAGVGSASSLNEDLSGTTTPVTVSLTWNAPETITSFRTPFGDGRAFQSPSANAELMYGGLGSNGGTATIGLSGLPSAFSSGFSLYVYASDTNTNNRGGSFTIDSGSPQNNLNTDPGSPPNTWTQSTSGSTAGDYLLFTGLSGSTLTISMTAPIDNEIQGFELVSTTAVPEPSTYAMLLGGLMLWGCLRLRRKIGAD